MDFAWLIPLLALVTILAALIFALTSKKKTEQELHSNTQPSSLATDGKDDIKKD